MQSEWLAIVGSTCALYQDAEPVIRGVIERYRPAAIVSGGAEGIDLMAASIAKIVYCLPVIECQPAGKGWVYFKPRNELIGDICTRLVRIVSDRSTTYGSGWTADYTRKLGKPVEEHRIP